MRQRIRNSIAYRIGRNLRRSKCFLLNRRGDGVHSPYAFRLIHQVLRNPHPYTAFVPLAGLHALRCKDLGLRYGDRAITARRYLEVIFRLAVDIRPERALVLTLEDSLAPNYLAEAIGSKNVEVVHFGQELSQEQILASRLIVAETASSNQITILAQTLSVREKSDKALLLVLNTYNPELRRMALPLRQQLRPDIQFDLKGLELWVWRIGLTPGRYSVYN